MRCNLCDGTGMRHSPDGLHPCPECGGCGVTSCCEGACGWSAIYIDPPREMLKRKVYPLEILTPKKGKGLQKAAAAAE